MRYIRFNFKWPFNIYRENFWKHWSTIFALPSPVFFFFFWGLQSFFRSTNWEMFSCIKKETKHLREKYRSKGFYVGVCSHSATKNSLNFSIPMVKIREALPEYRALAPSSEPISPKAGLKLKPRLSNSANILGDTWLLAEISCTKHFFFLSSHRPILCTWEMYYLFFFLPYFWIALQPQIPQSI